MNKKTITILIVTIAVIGVFFFMFNTDKKTNEVAPVAEEVSVEKEAPIKEGVPVEVAEKIEGWQTFRSEELGFEVQYPEGWFVKEYSDDQIVSFGPGWSRPGGGLWHVNIGMSENLEDEVEKFISNQNEYHTVDRNSIKNIEIDEYSAIILESRTETPGHYRPQTKIFFIKNGKLFRILENEDATTVDNPDHDNGETFRMFYESFRFIN